MGHEVFKHRARPGDRPRVGAAAGHRAPERAPVPPSRLPGGDRVIAGGARLAHEEIVVGAGGIAVPVEADRQELAAAVVEDGKIRPFQQRLHASDKLPHPRLLRGVLPQALPQRDERAEEVSAVHRRDKRLGQHPQVVGRVPVIEISPVSLKLFDRRERMLDAGVETRGVDQVQVSRREHREQHHADVGRRGAPRNGLHRRILDVVGRQVVVLLPGIVLVETEHLGAEGEQALPLDAAGQRFDLRRRAGGRCRDGRVEQKERAVELDDEALRRREDEQAETDELGKPASPQHGEHPRVARLPLCGGRPLEQVLVGDCHPPEGAAGRVEGDDRLLGGHDRAEQRLPQQFEDARQCAREIAAGQREPPAVQDGAHRAQKRRERAREEGQRTEQQRGPLRQKSRRDHAGKRRRRRQRAAEVVEELVFCEQADRIGAAGTVQHDRPAQEW